MFEVAEEEFTKSAAAVKAELKRLGTDLQRADASGDRPKALNILSRMLDLQRKFMDRWLRSPERSGSNPDSA